jgi:hypothetical protein
MCLFEIWIQKLLIHKGIRADVADTPILAETRRADRTRLIEKALRNSGGNKQQSAQALDLSRQGLMKKLKRLGLRTSFRIALFLVRGFSQFGQAPSNTNSPQWQRLRRDVARWLVISLSVADPFGCRCLTSSSMLRLPIPLIEPHVRIFRIRLSDPTCSGC